MEKWKNNEMVNVCTVYISKLKTMTKLNIILILSPRIRQRTDECTCTCEDIFLFEIEGCGNDIEPYEY